MATKVYVTYLLSNGQVETLNYTLQTGETVQSLRDTLTQAIATNVSSGLHNDTDPNHLTGYNPRHILKVGVAVA